MNKSTPHDIFEEVLQLNSEIEKNGPLRIVILDRRNEPMAITHFMTDGKLVYFKPENTVGYLGFSLGSFELLNPETLSR